MLYATEIKNSEEFLLTNDTIIAAIKDLKPVFTKMNNHNNKYDIWGLNEGYCRLYQKYHLSSYFLVMKKPVFNSIQFWRFWQKYRLTQSRRLTISSGEIKFSKVMRENNFALGSFINTTDIYNYINLKTDNFNDIDKVKDLIQDKSLLQISKQAMVLITKRTDTLSKLAEHVFLNEKYCVFCIAEPIMFIFLQQC